MSNVDSKIEVNVPVRTAYNQWTQFEEFPRFMESIESVEQMGDERLHWVADIGGTRKEWYARISRQVPDQVLAWESEGGATNNGTIIFHELAPDRTEVEVHMSYEPEDVAERLGGALGFVSGKVEGDLKRFKEFIEARGRETGAWRGEIAHGAPNDEQSQLHLKTPGTSAASPGYRTGEGIERSNIVPGSGESASRRAEEQRPPPRAENPLQTHDTGAAYEGTAIEGTEPGRDVPPTRPRI